MKRVVVTGLGLLTPLGNDPESFFAAATAGKSCIRRIRKFDTGRFLVRIGAEIDLNDQEQADFSAIQIEMPTTSKWSILAARKAILDANLDLCAFDPYEMGVILGSSLSSMDALSTTLSDYSKIRPATPILLNPASSAIHVSRELGIHGELVNITTACSSSGSAILHAARTIMTGELTCVLTGGAEEAISPLFLGSFGNGRCLSEQNDDPKHASRPFDRTRNGYVLGDAACILVLEEYERARLRGARIYCEIGGVGGTSDASTPFALATSVEPGARAIEKALKQGSVAYSEVDYYCAAGASDKKVDLRETLTVKRVFRESARGLSISSIKSMMGHPLGAAGAIQVATAALAIFNSAIPPTINYEQPDPDCDLDYVPNVARSKKIRNAVIYTLGNTVNAGVLLKAC